MKTYFDEYLKDREQSDKSMASMADCFLNINANIKTLDNVVFINLLRGSIIPCIIMQNICPSNSMMINIPASCDEVGPSQLFEILKIYLKKEYIEKFDIVWIDEAYSGRMGAVMSILLLDILRALKARSFSVFFIADEHGKFIKKEYSSVLDKLKTDFEGFMHLRTCPVDSLHWMDSISLTGINWGRRYTCINTNILKSLREHSYKVLRSGIDTKDYLMEYHKAKTIIKEGRIYPLDSYYHDPHTIWCKNDQDYSPRYEYIEGNPQILIQFSLNERNKYIKKIIEIIKTRQFS